MNEKKGNLLVPAVLFGTHFILQIGPLRNNRQIWVLLYPVIFTILCLKPVINFVKAFVQNKSAALKSEDFLVTLILFLGNIMFVIMAFTLKY